jgi:hypothetical protein
MVRIAGVSLLLGIVFSFQATGLGAREWAILVGFAVLGFCAGAVQAQAIAKARRGAMSKTMRNVLVILSFAVLFAIKGIVTSSVVSHLQNSGDTLLVQIFFSIFGLFLARGLLLKNTDQKPSAVR